MRFIDEQGRVEKFQTKLANAAKWQASNKSKVLKKTAAKAQTPKTLKEMLAEVNKSADKQ